MTKPARMVHIVDDDPSVREALADLLESVGVQNTLYPSADAFISSTLPDCPSCLILDVRMPGQSGLELQNTLNTLKKNIPIIFITAHGDIPMSVRALKNGATDFLPKPFSDQALLDAINHALNKDQKKRHILAERTTLKIRYNTLNQGEQDVLSLVVQGLMNKQIAADLNVSEITVKVRRAHVMKKMEAGSLAVLVRYYDTLMRDEKAL